MLDWTRLFRTAIRGTRSAVLLLPAVFFAACSTRPAPPSVPLDETRHRAALTTLAVQNRTDQILTIAFRSATPPAQEVVLGSVWADSSGRVAPIPAGEPIILFARKPGGGELALPVRSYPLDGAWTWDIPATAVFRLP